MSTLRGPAQLADLQGALCVPTFNFTCGVDGRTEKKSIAIFHLPRLTPRLADGLREVFRMTSPFYERLRSPPYRRGLTSP